MSVARRVHMADNEYIIKQEEQAAKDSSNDTGETETATEE